jgi:hypothetical protein
VVGKRGAGGRGRSAWDAHGQRRRKSLTIDLPASLYRRFKAACVDRTMAEEVLALIERRVEEMEPR